MCVAEKTAVLSGVEREWVLRRASREERGMPRARSAVSHRVHPLEGCAPSGQKKEGMCWFGIRRACWGAPEEEPGPFRSRVPPRFPQRP